jgi:DnaJ-class molecular chaperone
MAIALMLGVIKKAFKAEAKMTNRNFFGELNLKEGASLNEIKAAYRKMAKTCHPDSNAGSGPGDPEKFKRASAAYRALLKDAASESLEAAKVPSPRKKREAGEFFSEGVPFVFSGVTSAGLDLYYEVIALRPIGSDEVSLNLPWTKKESCPKCLGEGVLLKRSGNGFVYKPHRCEKCEGKGFLTEETTIKVRISAEALLKGKIRIRNAGDYSPKTSERGDLYLTVELVDKLPSEN